MEKIVLIAAVLWVVAYSPARSAPPTTQQLASGEVPRVVRGTVEDVRTFKLKEVAEPQLLVKVRTTDGEMLVASIGSANTFRAGLIERGTKVGMLGQLGSINGKDVFFAQRVDTAPATQASATTKPSAQ